MATSREGMVLVPAGPFLMGSNEFAREAPPHTVDLPAVWMDGYPTTSQEHLAFL